jgi:hypothetical protein
MKNLLLSGVRQRNQSMMNRRPYDLKLRPSEYMNDTTDVSRPVISRKFMHSDSNKFLAWL